LHFAVVCVLDTPKILAVPKLLAFEKASLVVLVWDSFS